MVDIREQVEYILEKLKPSVKALAGASQTLDTMIKAVRGQPIQDFNEFCRIAKILSDCNTADAQWAVDALENILEQDSGKLTKEELDKRNFVQVMLYSAGIGYTHKYLLIDFKGELDKTDFLHEALYAIYDFARNQTFEYQPYYTIKFNGVGYNAEFVTDGVAKALELYTGADAKAKQERKQPDILVCWKADLERAKENLLEPGEILLLDKEQ